MQGSVSTKTSKIEEEKERLRKSKEITDVGVQKRNGKGRDGTVAQEKRVK